MVVTLDNVLTAMFIGIGTAIGQIIGQTIAERARIKEFDKILKAELEKHIITEEKPKRTRRKKVHSPGGEGTEYAANNTTLKKEEGTK